MTITTGIVAFDPAAFKADFPAFSTISDPALQLNFNLATLQLDNSIYSVVQDVGIRTALLNLLVAHITALLNGVNGQPASGAVGRVSQATQGSVSAGLAYTTKSEAAAYYSQTPWGAQFWQSTVTYRTARYVSGYPTGREGGSWNAWPE